MGRIYTNNRQGLYYEEAWTHDIFNLNAGTNIAKLLGFTLGQEGYHDSPNIVSEYWEWMLRLQLITGLTAPSSYATGNEGQRLLGDTAVKGTYKADRRETGDGGSIAGGTGTTLFSWYWNVRFPMRIEFPPERCPVLTPDTGWMVLRMWGDSRFWTQSGSQDIACSYHIEEF